jgi:hypothetical protein
MGLQTYLKAADTSKKKGVVEGKILSAPALVYSDGTNVTYACDVDIGQVGVIDENGTEGTLPMYGVPLAAGNNKLLYAQVGNAVLLRLTGSGTWEIYAFSTMQPGTLTIVTISLPNLCDDFPAIEVQSTVQMGFTVVALTLEELGTFRPFGTLPLGSSARYLNNRLYDIGV